MIPANESAHNAHIGLEDCSLPENWNIVPLRRKCFLNTGATPSRSRSDFWQGDINWFSSKDLKSKLLPDSEEKITHLAVDTTGLRLHPAGTLVACFRSGILRHTFPVAIGTEPFTVNQDLRAITLSQDCSSHFVLYYLMGMNNSILASCRKIGATVESIETKWFLDYPLVVPPLLDQQLIVDFLDEKTAEIDGLVGQLEREVELLERYRRELIAHTVTHGLNPDAPMRDSGIDWVGKIPRHWKMLRIASLYDERSAKVSDQDFPPLSVTMQGILPQIETVAKTNDGDNRKLIKKGDFVINSRSDRRGACGIADRDGSCSLINTVLKPQQSIHNPFFNYLFRSNVFADEFYKWGHGIVDDLWTTRWTDMKVIQVPVPPIAEQRMVAEFLKTRTAQLDLTILNINKQIELLGKYRKQVINDAVTGKVRVEGAE